MRVATARRQTHRKRLAIAWTGCGSRRGRGRATGSLAPSTSLARLGPRKTRAELLQGTKRFLLSSLVCVSALACSRGRSGGGEQPSPSSSVVTLGVALGDCPDLSACERECEAGSADRCRRLGVTYALGQGVDKDEARAAALYEHACEMNDPSACIFAGQMSEFARGVPKDDSKAARFYERACNRQWAPGCYNLAIMYERGTGVVRDRNKAASLYQTACTAGAKVACDKAKEMQEPPPLPFLDGALP
jgi:hypothetical protein